MAKVSNAAKQRYTTKMQEFKGSLEAIEKREQATLKAIASHPEQEGIRKLSLAHDTLNLVSYYLLMNDLSVALLGVKNEGYLNNARKGCYKSIIYIEDVVTGLVDAPFSDYEERLEKIKNVEEEKRYFLIRKLGFAIQSVVAAFGENSKWKWSFVELEARFAAVCKNLIDLKNVIAEMDPRKEGYEIRVQHLNLVKRLLQKSADRYRQKYELSTLRIDDFKLAIHYLAALRRLHMVLGESDEADELRKKIEIWKTKMETDSKRIEQEAKKAGASTS